MMFFILLILVVVAAINLVATLVMIVKEKQTDIAILRTIGAAPVNVLRMFLVQGALIGLVGTVAGALLGWVLALNVTEAIHGIESVFGIKFLDASVYLMSDLPSEVRVGDVLQVSLMALALSALATIYPAWRAAARCPPRRFAMNEGAMNEVVLEATGVTRAFRQGPIDLTVLQGVNLACAPENASPSSAPPVPARPRCCRSWAASTGRRPAS